LRRILFERQNASTGACQEYVPLDVTPYKGARTSRMEQLFFAGALPSAAFIHYPHPFSLSLAINQMGQAVRCLQ
jgi:hypothetical protein